MPQDLQPIVDAIIGLQQPSSILKSYVFPIIPAVFTTLAGFFIASYNFKRQESIKADAQKIEAANKFIVQMDSAFQSLISAKTRYKDVINDVPLDRAFSIGKNTAYFSTINGVDNLVFLAKGCKVVDGQPYYVTWNNVPRINAMVGNYLYLLDIIKSRNSLLEQLETHISYTEEGHQTINFSTITPEAYNLIKLLVNSTEIMLKLTDGLIIEFNSFMSGIDEAIGKSINTKRVSHLTTIVKFNTNNPFIQNALQPIPEPNYSELAKLFGRDEESVRSMFDVGYF